MSKPDHGDGASSNAEKEKQKEDTAQKDPEKWAPTSTTEKSTGTVPSTPSLSSNNNDRVYGADGADAFDAIMQMSYPCGPCKRGEFPCNGVYPMCSNCEWDARRCP